MNSKSKGSYVKRNLKITTRKIGSKWMILEKDRSHMRTLNETAGLIWSLTKNPTTIMELVNKIAKTYKAPRKEVEKDVKGFVKKYLENEFLVKVKK